MKKTVEKELKKIARYVERETGSDILDFLYDAHDNYEYDEDGNPATCDYIIRGLWNEADYFLYTVSQNKKTLIEKIRIICDAHGSNPEFKMNLYYKVLAFVPENADITGKDLFDILGSSMIPLEQLEDIYIDLRKGEPHT